MTKEASNTNFLKNGSRNRVWLFPMVFFAIVSVFSIFYLDSSNEKTPLVAEDGIWRAIIKSKKPISVVLGDLQVFQSSQDPVQTPLPQSYLTTASPQWIKQLSTIFSSISTAYQIQTISQFNTEALKTSDLIVVGTQATLGMFQSYWTPSQIKYNTLQNFFFYEGNNTETAIPYQPRGNTNGLHTDYGYFAKLPGPHNNTIYIVSGTKDTGTMQSLYNFTDPSLLSRLEKQMVTKFGELPDYFEVFFEVNGIDASKLNSEVVHLFEINN